MMLSSKRFCEDVLSAMWSWGKRESSMSFSSRSFSLVLFFRRTEPRCVTKTLPTMAIYDPFFFGISTGFESMKAWNVMKWAYISSKCFYPRVRVCSFNSVEQRARLTRLIKDLGVQSSACLIFREALKDQGRLVTTYRRSVSRFCLETLLQNPR